MVVIYYTTITMTSVPMMLLTGVQTSADMKHHVEVFSEPFTLKDGSEAGVRSFLEKQFARFNDYNTNPVSGENDAEKQRFIVEKQSHTSMSVGDVVRLDLADGSKQLWSVQGRGWKKIN